ncbi:MAG: hypothetical protein HY820_25845 [Acidobacteria bacterium]|nr:hypothetical protein [Acidobacteriota bacterium]
MQFSVRTVDYYYTQVEDKPGKAYELLSELATEEISLLAFSAIPYGPHRVELTIFPDHAEHLHIAAEKLGWKLSGPQHAFLIQGDDRLGALADVHRKLLDAKVNIYASTGVTDGDGRFGYIIYVKESDHPVAKRALEMLS